MNGKKPRAATGIPEEKLRADGPVHERAPTGSEEVHGVETRATSMSNCGAKAHQRLVLRASRTDDQVAGAGRPEGGETETSLVRPDERRRRGRGGRGAADSGVGP
ncbi:hypothetical protein WOLCODRAFT_151097 [Wolfiporia cocos MD-104 SS10]|uniref:Uncharacterized protein n=1 Tax=Wolfiporia cocos (strain MD-104) TaxID=742152 RepID=A0A2H3JFS5_WOLCO|nr:hypothetical protein WOLCODRAFT_151097 [Wolfiporia cocos MD-104 SS10]